MTTFAEAAAAIAATDARILTLDIETKPNLVHTWGLWDQNVGINQIIEPGGVICFAAKWYGQKRVLFHSDHHDGHAGMVEAAYDLWSQADIVVHYNGTKFDLPHLRTEFVLAGMTPPPPVREVDLLKVARKHYRFPSNKLDYVAQALGIGSKVRHPGHQLWIDCMAGDPKAWAMMRRYNIGDVRLTEQVYDRLRPWISNHIPLGLWGDPRSCNACGSLDIVQDGWHRTALTTYARYKCLTCGAWLRSGSRKNGAEVRGAT